MPTRRRLIYTPLAIAPLIALVDQWSQGWNHSTSAKPDDWLVFSSTEDMAIVWARLDRVASQHEGAFAKLVDQPADQRPAPRGAVSDPSGPCLSEEAAAVLQRLRRGPALHMLDASLAVAQATQAYLPLRFVLAEEADGSSTLAYLPPTRVFAPFVPEMPNLATMAKALQTEFESIVRMTLLSDDPLPMEGTLTP